ncbi:MAG TPA: pitrilysin family protein [Pyrinomonadaceae bacterium]|nr:pitrilysin family protein [Pyrinomonadaceae bacterium]
MNQIEEFRRQPPEALARRPLKIPREVETTFGNGLRIAIVEDQRLPLVSFRLVFPAGDAHDPADLPGLLDMLTGLLTEGTESHNSKEIAEEVARMGATLSSGANSDYTTLAASALSSFSDNVLELLAEVALKPSFPEHEVELTRQNTKESLRQQRAQPSFLANEMVSRVVFGEHPYSKIAPTPASLDAITRDDLVRLHGETFLPNHSVLIIVGDVNADELVKRVERLFGGWKKGLPPGSDFPEPPRRASRSAYIIDRPGSAQSNLVIANAGITRTSPDYFPMLLMHTVLGATASSRLFMNLREEKGYTYGAYSSLDARRTAGTFRVSAEVRTPVTGDSLKEFLYELDRIRNEPVTDKELADAKSYLTGVFPIRLETQEGLIDQLVQIRMFNLPADYLETYRDKIQAVTTSQIQEVAKKHVTPEQAAIIVVGDGGEALQQVGQFTSEIEFYNTAGKRKGKPGAETEGKMSASDVAGKWVLDIQTPFGQAIAAVLTLEATDSGLSGKVESEMGNAVLTSASLFGNTLKATLSFSVDGHDFNAEVSATVDADNIEGTINLQDSQPLPFTGSKGES